MLAVAGGRVGDLRPNKRIEVPHCTRSLSQGCQRHKVCAVGLRGALNGVPYSEYNIEVAEIRAEVDIAADGSCGSHTGKANECGEQCRSRSRVTRLQGCFHGE